MPKNVGKIFLTEQTLPAPWGRSWLSKLKSWCLLLARSSSTDWYCLWSLQLHKKYPCTPTVHGYRNSFKLQMTYWYICTWCYSHIAIHNLPYRPANPVWTVWMGSEVQTGRTWGLREGVELLWCFQEAFFPQEPQPHPCSALQIHTCNKGPALSAWLLAGTQLFGTWDPALLARLLRGAFLAAPGHSVPR